MAQQNNAMQSGGLGTPHAAAVVVIGALAFLIMIRMGFRGVSIGGFNVGVN